MDPGLNPLDLMNRAALVGAGFTEDTAGSQTFFFAGDGVPLILLHGAGDHAGAWSRAAAPLVAAERYRIIILDLAGHGASGPAEGTLTMETFLEGLDAVACKAGTTPVTLVGNSFGAWLAIVWASLHPERVSRIIAVNGGPVTGLRPDLTLTPADHEEARRLWQALVAPDKWPVPDFVLDELIRKSRVGAMRRMDPEFLRPHLMDDRLPQIETPVDLLWGEADQVLPLEYARLLEAGLPRVRFTAIAGCGHVPQMEAPDRFNQALRDILDQPPPGRKTS